MKTVRKTADERKVDRFLQDYMSFFMGRLRRTPLYSESDGRRKPGKNARSGMGHLLDERALDEYVDTVLRSPRESGILEIDGSDPVPRLLNPRLLALTRKHKKAAQIGAEKAHAGAERIHVDVENIKVDRAALLTALGALTSSFSGEMLAFEIHDRIMERGIRELNVACGGVHAYISKGAVPKEWRYVGGIYRAPPAGT